MSESIWTQASLYTLDKNLQAVLKRCDTGKYPSQFKISKNKIVTFKGNVFDIPMNPMELSNLIHDIMNGQEKVQRSISLSEDTRRSSRSTGSNVGVSDDAIYSFARRETRRLKRDDYHKDLLISCIFTAILLEDITSHDFILNGDKIVSIRYLNTDKICIEK